MTPYPNRLFEDPFQYTLDVLEVHARELNKLTILYKSKVGRVYHIVSVVLYDFPDSIGLGMKTPCGQYVHPDYGELLYKRPNNIELCERCET